MSDLQRASDLLAGAWPGQRMHQPIQPPALADWPVPRTADAVPDARHYIRELAAGVIGYGSLSGDLELMAGELLANAVDHGDGKTMQVRVTVTSDRRAVRVEVRDCGANPLRESHRPALLGERGRGLLIVAAFATKWGIHHDASGTTAWFELATGR